MSEIVIYGFLGSYSCPYGRCTAASKMLGIRQPAASLLQISVINEVYCKHWTGLTVCTWYAGQSLNLSNSKLI
jgi:hypothetical protein